jgi:putative Mg2+ transporter-C (MgtC) family protein
MTPIYETIFRLILGAFIGGIIGFEREVHGRAAGFRTQLIVCVASVLIMIVSENYYFILPPYYDTLFNTESVLRIDPGRIASGAIIGIGFLGAGVIVKSGFTIRGLTTAASLWIVSVIGLAIGGGLYLEGISTALLTVIALVILRKIEKGVKILVHKTISISAQFTDNLEEAITALFSDCGIQVLSVDYEKNTSTRELIYHFHISTRNKKVFKEILQKLDSIKNIKKIIINNYRTDNVL